MNSVTGKEKKALYVLASLFMLCVFKYTLFDLQAVSSNIESFLTILILGLISIYIYFQPRAYQQTKDRLIGYYFTWLLACGIIYILIYFGCGFLFGFGRSPYKRDFSGIMFNVLMLGGTIVLKEWIRNFVINKVEKKRVILYGAVIVILYTLIDVNILNLFAADTTEAFVAELSEKILPILSLNIFMTFVCYLAGYLPAMVYMLITNLPIWFFDNIPNLEWIVIGVLGIAYPMIALVALMETIDQKNAIKTKRINSEPKTVNVLIWILVGTFCIVISFFTAGLLSTFPTVLVSGSMSPVINRGDIVIVKKLGSDDEIYLDDIIMYNAGDFDVVHRVIDTYYDDGEKIYITKGDANEHADNIKIKTKNIKGVIVARIPYIGLPRLLIESTEYEDEINYG